LCIARSATGMKTKTLRLRQLGVSMDGWISTLGASTLASEKYFFPNLESPEPLPDDFKSKIAALQAWGVKIMPYKKITKVTEDSSGNLVIHLSDQSTYSVSWILYKPKTAVSTPELVSELGLGLTPMGDIQLTGPFKETTVPGVFAAGDCATMQKSIPVAVGEGAIAAAGIHFTLAKEDAEGALNAADK